MTIKVTTSQAVRTNWVPVEACTLPTADQPLRLAEFEELFASGLHAPERLESTWLRDRKSTRLNSSHVASSYAVPCLKKLIATTVNDGHTNSGVGPAGFYPDQLQP